MDIAATWKKCQDWCDKAEGDCEHSWHCGGCSFCQKCQDWCDKAEGDCEDSWHC